ncbi:MAG TPA: regulatory iron-sulfur-containing complex subunit RicT [Phycisphaerae bacterium]|nr:regulatory iron-sulfur-containing complex subunit RicT [Phycisphaerae bacterium]
MVINVHNGESADQPKSGGCGSGCSPGQCGNGLEKVYPTAVVRYGYMRAVGEFRYPNDGMKFGCGANVIIQTNRGIEMGEMVSVSCDGCDKCVSRDQIRTYVENSGPEYFHFSNGKILRLATPEDVGDWEHIRAEALRKKKFCQEQAEKARLDMKVLECEHLFGGERIVFYFMAEGRIDFRTLVRGLADEFQTRIEMRQVGARDEARLLADYETCGRECCCKNFLKELRPISMKMAKMQKATLDPAKVSGRCGRLKCCLRYEHTNYEDLNRKLPGMGRRVITEQGAATVIGRQILTQLLHVQTEDGGRFTVALEDLIDEAELQRRQQEKAAALAARQAEAAAQRRADAAQRGGGSGSRNGAGEERSRANRSRRSRRRGGSGGQKAGSGAQPGAERAPKPDANATPERGDAGESTSRPGNDQGGGDNRRRRRRRGRRSSRGRSSEGGRPSDGGGSGGGGGPSGGGPPSGA